MRSIAALPDLPSFLLVHFTKTFFTWTAIPAVDNFLTDITEIEAPITAFYRIAQRLTTILAGVEINVIYLLSARG